VVVEAAEEEVEVGLALLVVLASVVVDASGVDEVVERITTEVEDDEVVEVLAAEEVLVLWAAEDTSDDLGGLHRLLSLLRGTLALLG